MKRLIRSLIIALALITFTISFAWAGTVEGLIEFAEKTPAKAADVNANFDAVQDAVDDNDARIFTLDGSLPTVDMDKYLPPTGIEKDFRIDFDTPNPSSVTVIWTGNKEVWQWEAGHRNESTFTASPEGFLQTEEDQYTAGGGLSRTFDFDPPLRSVMPSGKRLLGTSWGGGSTNSSTSFPVGPPLTGTSRIVEYYTVLGMEDVTVPADTFENCLVVSRDTSAEFRPDGGTFAVFWLAEGIGWVQAILGDRLYELTDFTLPPP